MRKFKIAFTIALDAHNQYQATWGSGIVQNILLVYQLYRGMDIVEDACLLDLNQEAAVTHLTFANQSYKIINAATAITEMDVIIEVGGQIWTNVATAFQQKGGKVVAMRCGNAFIDEVMGIFFPHQPLIPVNFVQYDQFWTLPHHAPLSAAMLKTMFHTQVKVIPYIWEPQFINHLLQTSNIELDYAAQQANNRAAGDLPHPLAKRIAICEPNLSPIKTFHIPLLVCEALQQKKPEYLNKIRILNAQALHENPSALHFVNRLHCFKHVMFDMRYDIAQILSTIGDVVVSHHWENGLNNLYFDVLYAGYPLVHNSAFLKEVGYYYPDFDIDQGAIMLQHAIEHHEEELVSYREKAHRFLAGYSIHHAANIAHYRALLLGIFD